MYTLDPVQQHSASAELQKGTTLTLEFLKRLQNLFLRLLNNPFIPLFFFSHSLRRKNCSVAPGIVGSSREIEVVEKGALYPYFMQRHSEVQRGHPAGQWD